MTEFLYNEAIKTLAKERCGHGRLISLSASAQMDNPLCGDQVVIDVLLEKGRIVDVGHRVKGCLLCQAAASVIGMRAIGSGKDEIGNVLSALSRMLRGEQMTSMVWEQLSVFVPVYRFQSRVGCVLLPFKTLEAALTSATTVS